jgi:Zn-dependent protease with chaperone function
VGLVPAAWVLIGETAVASWSDNALSGLIAHEFAHIVLGHGRLSPSVALPTIAFGMGYFSLIPTFQAPFDMAAYVIADIGAIVWLIALMLVVDPTFYPGEVAADALVVKQGYGPQLRVVGIRALAIERARWRSGSRWHPGRPASHPEPT